MLNMFISNPCHVKLVCQSGPVHALCHYHTGGILSRNDAK